MGNALPHQKTKYKFAWDTVIDQCLELHIDLSLGSKESLLQSSRINNFVVLWSVYYGSLIVYMYDSWETVNSDSILILICWFSLIRESFSLIGLSFKIRSVTENRLCTTPLQITCTVFQHKLTVRFCTKLLSSLWKEIVHFAFKSKEINFVFFLSAVIW